MIKKWSHIFLGDLAALLSGAAMVFAFAPYELFPLAILAPSCLLGLWLYSSIKRAFWLGFLFGMGFFGLGAYWVFISVHVIAGVPSLLAGLLTTSFVMGLAFFPGAAGYVLNRYFPNNSTAKITCAFPAIWVFSEWARSWIYGGFPWLLLGYSQTNSPLKGYAPLFSVYGVSLAVVAMSGLFVNLIIQSKQKKYSAVYLNLLILFAISFVGGIVNLLPWTKASGNTIPVSLVQGNIPQRMKWSPEHINLSFERYEKLTEPLWGKNKLIIWPEAALPLTLQDSARFLEFMHVKATANDANLILGIPIQSSEGFYNAIITLGNKQLFYFKRLLVPFGEYTPFSFFLGRFIKSLNIPMADGIAGKMQQDPFILNDTKILSFICSEIAYPELVRSRDKTIGLLLTVSNDGWFGKSSAQAQHLQIGKMRALELARPVLFVGNNGITAIIGPKGEIEAAAPPHEIFVLNGTVQPRYGLTPWMRNGMDPILFILICLILVAVRSQKIVDK